MATAAQIHIEGDTALLSPVRCLADGGSGKGGDVKILGDSVEVSGNAYISAQGDSGGGEILIGGDYKGENAEVRNATTTTLGADAVVDASGNGLGDGGKVIVWADEDSYFYGTIDASSGLLGGDGGFVETSGKQRIVLDGQVVAKSHRGGKAGTWLIDPEYLAVVSKETYESNGTGHNILSADVITSVLNSGTSIELTTKVLPDSSDRVDHSSKSGDWNSGIDTTDSTHLAPHTFNQNYTSTPVESGSIYVETVLAVNVGSDAAADGSGRAAATLTMTSTGGSIYINKAIVNNASIDSVVDGEVVGYTNGAGNAKEGLNIVLQADKNIAINADIFTGGGDIQIRGNDNPGADGVTVASGVDLNTIDTIVDPLESAAGDGDGSLTVLSNSFTNSGNINLKDGALSVTSKSFSNNNSNGGAAAIIAGDVTLDIAADDRSQHRDHSDHKRYGRRRQSSMSAPLITPR